MNFLIDYNLQKYAAILLGKIANDGWLDLIPIRFTFFNQLDLPTDSNDRLVWQLSQKNRMILMTANRSPSPIFPRRFIGLLPPRIAFSDDLPYNRIGLLTPHESWVNILGSTRRSLTNIFPSCRVLTMMKRARPEHLFSDFANLHLLGTLSPC